MLFFLISSSRSKTIVSQDFFTCPVSEQGDCFIPELIRFSPTPNRHLLLVWTLLFFFPTGPGIYLDFAQCDHCCSSETAHSL